MSCVECGQGFHSECSAGGDECCGKTSTCSAKSLWQVIASFENADDPKTRGKDENRKYRRGPYKQAEDMLDPESTGRKRAAELYPVDKEADCEWRGLANVGGGKHPIVGCLDGKQQHIQHGPDKNTLNISPENIHRICVRCHNLWHAHNDGDYDPNGPFIAHDPREGTLEELGLWSRPKTRPKPVVPRNGSFALRRKEDDTEDLHELRGEEASSV